jgi:hypothetical protein
LIRDRHSALSPESVESAVPNGSIGKLLNLEGMEPDTPSKLAILAVAFRSPKAARRRCLFGSIMPFLRYFTFVGGALLALLIVVSSFLPEPETITRPDAARPVIRIASNRVGPPRVDIDTRVGTAVVPASVSEVLRQAPARVAEGQLSTPLPTAVVPGRIQRKKTRIAKRPDRQRMAANPLGFQAFHSTW